MTKIPPKSEWKKISLAVGEYMAKKLDKYSKPGKCVECFKEILEGEIICGSCQDILDGYFDHLKNKDKKENG